MSNTERNNFKRSNKIITSYRNKQNNRLSPMNIPFMRSGTLSNANVIRTGISGLGISALLLLILCRCDVKFLKLKMQLFYEPFILTQDDHELFTCCEIYGTMFW